MSLGFFCILIKCANHFSWISSDNCSLWNIFHYNASHRHNSIRAN